MILRDLLPDTLPVQVQGSLGVEIAYLAYDSRLVEPGTFAAGWDAAVSLTAG